MGLYDNNQNATNNQDAVKAAEAAAEKRTRAAWYRFGVIASVILGVACGLYLGSTQEWYIGLISGLLIFCFGLHIGHDTFIFNFFVGAWGKSIQLPGIIFSLDLGSVLFMLAYRFIIAPLLSLAIGIVFGIGGTIIAICLSPFSLIFTFPRLIKEIVTGEDVDSIFD